MPKHNKRKNRGGYRPGSGPKKTLEGSHRRLIQFDAPTVQVMTEAGDGNLSRGIRLAAIILSYLPTSDRDKLLETARGYEIQNIERIRGEQVRGKS
jgi:hypothetical protein